MLEFTLMLVAGADTVPVGDSYTGVMKLGLRREQARAEKEPSLLDMLVFFEDYLESTIFDNNPRRWAYFAVPLEGENLGEISPRAGGRVLVVVHPLMLREEYREAVLKKIADVEGAAEEQRLESSRCKIERVS